MEKTYQVYVIQNPAGRFYIGLTEDVTFRLQQHNDGISTWTRTCGPWKLVWTNSPLPLGPARKLENLLKRQKGGSGFYKMTGLIDPPAIRLIIPRAGSLVQIQPPQPIFKAPWKHGAFLLPLTLLTLLPGRRPFAIFAFVA